MCLKLFFTTLTFVGLVWGTKGYASSIQQTRAPLHSGWGVGLLFDTINAAQLAATFQKENNLIQTSLGTKEMSFGWGWVLPQLSSDLWEKSYQIGVRSNIRLSEQLSDIARLESYSSFATWNWERQEIAHQGFFRSWRVSVGIHYGIRLGAGAFLQIEKLLPN